MSVIVAAFEAEAFVAHAIESALAQSGVSVEVLVSDDGSSDGTVAAAEACAARDARVGVLRAPCNAGPSAARNRALDAAKGRWVAVLDSDDGFLPGRLERLVAFAEERGCDVVFDRYAERDAEGRRTDGAGEVGPRTPERWDLSRWAMDNRMYEGTGTGYLKPMIRRAFLDENAIRYDEALRNSEDYALVAEVLARGGAVWYLPETGYLYTRRAGSLSHRITQNQLEALIDADEAFRARHPHLGPDVLAALDERTRSLRRAVTLASTIDALKERAPLRAAGALARQPSASALFMRWVGETAGKRINAAFRRLRRS